jgi:regulator of protease activity HflC (stomatin/prohibitin superfamily)
MRYEIKDIKPPEQIKRSMELQAESERIKRSKILNSEGEMRSKINIAEGVKREAVLNGEGQARKIMLEAESLCESLDSIAFGIKQGVNASEAMNLRLTEQYLEALEKILAKSSTLMVPPGGGQSMAELMTTYKHIMGADKSQKMA